MMFFYDFRLDVNDGLESSYANVTLTNHALDDVDSSRTAQLAVTHKNVLALLGLAVQPQNPGDLVFSSWNADLEGMSLSNAKGGKQLTLRRVSTPSSVNSGDQWATNWQWYFLVSCKLFVNGDDLI